jgi:hypothetical protein
MLKLLREADYFLRWNLPNHLLCVGIDDLDAHLASFRVRHELRICAPCSPVDVNLHEVGFECLGLTGPTASTTGT